MPAGAAAPLRSQAIADNGGSTMTCHSEDGLPAGVISAISRRAHLAGRKPDGPPENTCRLTAHVLGYPKQHPIATRNIWTAAKAIARLRLRASCANTSTRVLSGHLRA